MFDTEKMIIQVQQRPCLWNLSDKLYSDKLIKQKAWQEVAEDCFDEWHSLNYEDKGKKLDFLQKKWKYVRDYYMREKKKGSNDRSGSAAKKKRSCSYFDLLEFLNVTKPRYSNVTSTENSEKDSKNNARTITENKNNDRNVTENENNDRNITENKNNDKNVTENENNDKNVTKNENNDKNVTKIENNDRQVTKNENNDRKVSGCINDEDIDDKFVPIEAISQRITTQPASLDPVHPDLASSSKQIPGESVLGTKNKNVHQESRPKQFDSHDEDPNRFFLLSLMPEMSKMTEKQNFEFRMEVMRALNKVMYQIPD